MPPLRERREDVPLLARHFLRIWAAEMGTDPPPLTSEVLGRLSDYDYPGNVRELENLIESALIQAGGMQLRPEHLHFLKPVLPPSDAEAPPDEPSATVPRALPHNLKQAEATLIQQALDDTAGNIAAAARRLGTNRTKIYRYLESKDRQGPQP